MQTEIFQVSWMHESQRVTVDELAAMTGLSEAELVELVDAGAVVPLDFQATQWTFAADCVPAVRQAARLRDELELDMHALVVAMKLLAQIDELRREVAALRARQPAFRIS